MSFPTISICLSLYWVCSVHVVIDITCIHFYFFACAHSSLGWAHSFHAGILIYALLGVQQGLLCLECIFFIVSSSLRILITVFRSGSARSLNFALVRSLHTLDIIWSRIMLSFTRSKTHFSACEVMFIKKRKNVAPSFWFCWRRNVRDPSPFYPQQIL